MAEKAPASSTAQKRSSKVQHFEDERTIKKEKSMAQNFGHLDFGNFPESEYKLSIRTFFGNPETEVFCVRFDKEDQLIAAGCSDGSVKIFNCATTKLEHSLNGFSSVNQTPTTSLRWRPEGSGRTSHALISVNSDGTVIHWHAPSGKQLHRLTEPGHSIMCLDYNPDGSKFATAGRDYHLRIYDEDTKSVVIDFPAADWNQRGHSNRIFATKFLQHDPNIVLTSGWDSNVQIWDLRERQSIAGFHGPSLSGDALDYHDGLILTGSYRNENQVQLWDFNTRKLFKNIEWNPDYPSQTVYAYGAQFSKEDKNTIAAGSSGTSQLMIYDVKKDYIPCASVLNVHDGIYSLDYANKSGKIAFGGGQGVVYILSLTHQHHKK